MKKLPSILSFVDVETTGSTPSRDRVIEIGILRVENNKIVGKLNTLVNPQGAYIPPFISDMTGISPSELETAPLFEEIKLEISDLLSDSLFVAHNVNFDYGFVKSEFSRLETPFRAKTLCTVRLARHLFPGMVRYNLDNLIRYFNLPMENRHRAYDDAYALWDFYQKAQNAHETSFFLEAIKSQLTGSIPKNLKRSDIEDLHQGAGVYIFWGKDGDGEACLYVGKSLNVKKRVMQHFSAAKFSGKEDRIFNLVTRIEVIKTHGELGALIRESDLVKELSPIYNSVLRRKTNMLALLRGEKNDYISAKLTRIETIDDSNMGQILAIYKSQKNAHTQIRDLAREYKLCLKLLGMESGSGSCFASQLELCNGACVGDEEPLRYNLRFLEAFSSTLVPDWPFEGPVLIIEESSNGKEIHKIDKWIYKGSVLYDKEGNESIGLPDSIFDWDIYKIVKRAIRKGNVKLEENNSQTLF